MYHNPRHGNKANPLDELIYIILSSRTRDESFRSTYRRLKQAYPSWERLQASAINNVVAVLAPGGLGQLKARQLVGILERLRSVFGRATLAPLRQFSDADAEGFLTSLPGVATKTAKCVLMYSLGRQVLPVDVHVHRLATRLGLTTKRRPDTSQDLIEAAIPPRLRYGFHVNAVAHGRAVCLPRRPRCHACALTKWCKYFQERRSE